jgi:hypothetical protein
MTTGVAATIGCGLACALVSDNASKIARILIMFFIAIKPLFMVG